MSDGAQRYLESYGRMSRSRTGFAAPAINFVRDRLDAKARRQGHADRFGLFLPRAIEICGLSSSDCNVVMELGAWNGWALQYDRPGLRKIAVDLAPNLADTLMRAGIEFHVADVSRDRLPIEDGAVDMLMMNHMIEHVFDPTFLRQECARVLRKGGACYIRTPDVMRFGHGFWEDYTHVKPYTRGSLRKLLDAFGFDLRVMLASSHSRIFLDMLTDGRFRHVLCRNGQEIEAAFVRR